MALPPCHAFSSFMSVLMVKTIFTVISEKCGCLLGVPFNIASYATLLMMVAQVCDLQPYEFIHTLGDVHIYKDHIEQIKLQLSREPRKLPTLKINPAIKNIEDFCFEDFEVVDYDPHPAIRGKVSV